MQLDLSALYAGVQTGDAPACQDLYAFIRKITWFWLCRRVSFLRGTEDPDDCLHDVYIIVVEAIRRGQIREPERLAGFIKTVNQRRIARLVEEQIRGRRNGNIEAAEGVATFQNGPECEAAGLEYSQIAEASLGELAPRRSEILRRHYLQEQNERQICREMNLTATQYRLLNSRAKAEFGEIGKRKLEGKNRAALLKRIAA